MLVNDLFENTLHILLEIDRDVTAAMREHNSVFLMTAHFGCWELGAHVASLNLPRCTALVRPLDNSRLDAVVGAARSRTGMELIHKHGAARRLVRSLDAGGAIIVLVDQRVERVRFGLPRLKPEEGVLSGQRVLEVEPRGKALLTHFENGLSLYSHNQLYGVWRICPAGKPPNLGRSLRVALSPRQRRLWSIHSPVKRPALVRGRGLLRRRAAHGLARRPPLPLHSEPRLSTARARPD